MDILNNNINCLQDINEPTVTLEDIDSWSEYIKNNYHDFKIFHLNIRSLNKNFLELCATLQYISKSFDVIVLTEAWLYDENGFDLPGYKKYVKTNKYNKCDSVVVYCNNNIDANLIDINIPHCNSLHLDLNVNKNPLTLTAIYRSPSDSKEEFLENLEQFMLRSKGPNTHIFVGDINIQILDDQLDSFGHRYMNIMHEYGFDKFLNAITRPASKACLDHIFFRNQNASKFIPGVYCSNITDHYVVFGLFQFVNKHTHSPPVSHPIITQKKLNQKKLISLIKEQSWEQIYNCQDADSCFLLFYHLLIKYIDESSHTTSNKIPCKLKKIKPWITTGIIKSIRIRDKLAKQIKNDTGNTNLINYYKKYRNTLTSVIRNMKANYYRFKFQEYRHDPRKFWQTINEATDINCDNNYKITEILKQDNLLIKDKKDITNAFNNYFSNIGHVITDSKKNHSNHITNIGNLGEAPATMFLTPVTENEILDSVKTLKNNVAPGIDKITNNLLKSIIQYISKPIVHVLNLCLTQGIFPDVMKQAVVVPIHKSGKKNDMNNYRPISLLPSLSKIFEKCIKNRLVNFLEKHKLLCNNQYGFRNNISADDAIMNVTGKIIKEIDAGHKCLGVFLDLRKAFDTVNHNLLLKKLSALGIRGIGLDLFKSYLANRKQVVKIENEISEMRNINIGVPQGTILGPILFLIYINDLLRINLEALHGDIYSYADDTVVIFSGLTWESAYENANTGIDLIKKWLDSNLMSLNINKTSLVPFSLTVSGLKQLKSIDHLKLTIHNSNCSNQMCQCPSLKEVSSVKYLGIIVDQHLKWDLHINYLCNRIRKTIFKFVTLRNILPINILKIVYTAIVESLIQYGILGWGGSSKTALTPLILLQKRIIKICLKKPKDYPTNLLYSEFKVFNINQIFHFSLLKYYHKNKNNFIKQHHEHKTRRNITPTLIEPKCFTTAAFQHSTSLGPRLYNKTIKLHPDLVKCNNNVFKNRIKNYI